MAIEYYDSLNVTATTASSFAGDVLIEDNLYLTDGLSTVRAKIQLNSSDRDDLDIIAVSLGSNMKFFTVNTERMRIDANGSVGIGTTAPDAILHIKGSTNTTEVKIDTDDNAIGDSALIKFNGSRAQVGWIDAAVTLTDGGGNKDIKLKVDTGSIFLQTNNTTRLAVADGGNVGIGTTSPGAKLQIGSATHAPSGNLANNFLQIKSSSGFAYLTIGNGDVANSTSYIGGASGFTVIGSVTDAGALSEHIRITNTGKVGIGTASPTEKLTVSGGANITGKFAVGISATHASFDLYNDGTSYFNGATTVDDTLDLVNLKVSGAQGTDGQVLTSTGSGVAWEDVSGGSSPWTTDTNGITYTAGNVGIGTASQAGLDLAVSGGARFNSDVRFDGNVSCAGGDLEVNNSLKDVNSATGTSGQILSSEGAGGGVEWIDAGVRSNTSEGGSGSVQVGNIVKITSLAYGSLASKDADTIYIIVG